MNEFPLPPELRLKIFGFILTGENARIDGLYSPQTSLMRVSRSFYRDAREVLYKTNDYIMVMSNKSDMPFTLWLEGVVCLRSPSPESFNGQRILLDFGTTLVSPALPRRVLSWKERQLAELGQRNRLIVHSHDLGNLVRAMRINCHCQPNAVEKLIFSASGERPLRFLDTTWQPPRRARASTYVPYHAPQSLQLLRDPYGRAYDEDLRNLVEPFKKAFSISGLDVTCPFGGAAAIARDVKNSTKSKVAWACAIGWDLVDVLRPLKTEIDRYVRSLPIPIVPHRLETATYRYERLLHVLNTAYISRDDILHLADASLGWPDALAALSFDATLCLAQCYIRMERDHDASRVVAAHTSWWRLLHNRRTLSEAMTSEGTLLHRELRLYLDRLNRAGGRSRSEFSRPDLMSKNYSKSIDRPGGLLGWFYDTERLSSADFQRLGVHAVDVPAHLLAAPAHNVT